MRSMISIRKRWASTLNVVVLGVLLLLPASPHGAEFVLCLEESGNVNVERSQDGECIEGMRDDGGHKIKILSSSNEEHCIDCSDVPLRLTEAGDPCGTALLSSTLDLEGPSKQLSLVSTRLESQVVESGASSLQYPPRFRRSRPEPDQDTSLSSVILLI